MSKHQCHVLISGRVQGGSFRASTQKKADELNLKGHVRNLPDGRVEALFQGGEDALNQMLDWCRQGPKGARVELTEFKWQKPEKIFDRFQVLQEEVDHD